MYSICNVNLLCLYTEKKVTFKRLKKVHLNGQRLLWKKGNDVANLPKKKKLTLITGKSSS